jgi:hypothetical protein
VDSSVPQGPNASAGFRESLRGSARAHVRVNELRGVQRQSSRYRHGSCMKQEPPTSRSEALRDAPVFGSNPFGGISSQGARPDALTKCASKSLGFARVDQIRRADFLGKRACPNDLPACGRPASKHEKNRPVAGSRGAQQRTSPLMRQSGGYTEECCTVERKREGSLRRKKRYAQLRNARSFCLRSVSQRSLLRLVFI